MFQSTKKGGEYIYGGPQGPDNTFNSLDKTFTSLSLDKTFTSPDKT